MNKMELMGKVKKVMKWEKLRHRGWYLNYKREAFKKAIYRNVLAYTTSATSLTK